MDIARAQDARVADENVEAETTGLQIMHLAARVAHVRNHVRRGLPEAEVFEAVDGRRGLAARLKAEGITLAPAWVAKATVGQLGCLCSHVAGRADRQCLERA